MEIFGDGLTLLVVIAAIALFIVGAVGTVYSIKMKKKPWAWIGLMVGGLVALFGGVKLKGLFGGRSTKGDPRALDEREISPGKLEMEATDHKAEKVKEQAESAEGDEEKLDQESAVTDDQKRQLDEKAKKLDDKIQNDSENHDEDDDGSSGPDDDISDFLRNRERELSGQ